MDAMRALFKGREVVVIDHRRSSAGNNQWLVIDGDGITKWRGWGEITILGSCSRYGAAAWILEDGKVTHP